jgi:hypothetical protein
VSLRSTTVVVCLHRSLRCGLNLCVHCHLYVPCSNGGSIHWGILGGTNGNLRCGKGTLWEGLFIRFTYARHSVTLTCSITLTRRFTHLCFYIRWGPRASYRALAWCGLPRYCRQGAYIFPRLDADLRFVSGLQA